MEHTDNEYYDAGIAETQRLINLYKTRLEHLNNFNPDLELCRVIKDLMVKDKSDPNHIHLYNDMSWGELVLHYTEHFNKKIKEMEYELAELTKEKERVSITKEMLLEEYGEDSEQSKRYNLN